MKPICHTAATLASITALGFTGVALAAPAGAQPGVTGGLIYVSSVSTVPGLLLQGDDVGEDDSAGAAQVLQDDSVLG